MHRREGSSRGGVWKRASVVGLSAIGVAACGGGGSTSNNTQPANLFDPSSFNESVVSWLTANVNATGSPPSTPTGTLVAVGGPDFSGALDPQGEYETTGFGTTELFSRRLVYYQPSSDVIKSQTVVPDAASSLPTVSADGKTYTFHLRSGVMWNTSPPRPVTSMDWENGLKRECDPAEQPLGNPAYYSAEIAGFATFCSGYGALAATADAPTRKAYILNNSVSGIQTPDDSTIVFTLTAPSVDFLNILSMPFAAAVPVEELDFVPQTAGNPIWSNGPYQISNCTGTSTAANYNDCTGYDVGHSVTLDDNTAWTQSSDTIRHQYLQHISIKLDLPAGGAGETQALEEMQAGTADLGWGSDTALPPANLAQFANFSDHRFGAFPAAGTTNPYLVFNVDSNNANGALKNVQVRQALEYAVDKAALVKIYGGTTYNQVLNQVIGPGAEGYQQFNLYPTPNDSGDPNKCKSMLASAGFPNGFTLNHYYRTNGNHPAVYQELKTDFAKCGVTLNGIPIAHGYYGTSGLGTAATTTSAAQAALATAKWDTGEPGWVPDWFGPTNGRAILADLFTSANCPGTNWGCYVNPNVDNLVNQAEAATSLQTANSLWHQADEQVMKDAAFVPFMTQLTPLYHSSRVHNAVWSPFSADYDLSVMWVS